MITIIIKAIELKRFRKSFEYRLAVFLELRELHLAPIEVDLFLEGNLDDHEDIKIILMLD